MKVTHSAFITQTKPLLKQLLDRLLSTYQWASILAVDEKEMRYSTSRSMTNIGSNNWLTNRGFVVKLFNEGHSTEYSFNDISEDMLDAICADIERCVSSTAALLSHNLIENTYEIPEEEDIRFSESTECEIDPEGCSDTHIMSCLEQVRDHGLAYDEAILDCQVMFEWQKYTRLFLSPKKDMEQSVVWSCASVATMALRDQEIKFYHDGASKLGGAELLEDLPGLVDACAAATLELLDSSSIEPGTYECICNPALSGMIAHEAFGHGVEMDMFVKDRALAKSCIGTKVASDIVVMHDGACARPNVASFFFDDEGTLAHDSIIIDHGILKQGISDLQSATILGTTPTGNGRRENYKRKAYTRMTNTYFEPGTSTKEEMIASVKDGFLLECPSSGMEDPKNWGIQIMVNVAREIKDGKLTGRIFSPIVLSGYVPDLLKSITMMSDEFELDGNGFCGKGYKEWVKVSCGGPYLKATIRLG